jgi:putative flippase GtrA
MITGYRISVNYFTDQEMNTFMNLWLGLGIIILGLVFVACAVLIAFTVLLLKIAFIAVGLIAIVLGIAFLLSKSS